MWIDLDVICVPLTSTWSKVKFTVTELLKFRKSHFSGSISSAILAWRSKLVVDHDSMGPILRLVRARFFNFLLRKLSHEFKLRGMSILQNFKEPYFRIAWGYSHMVGHVGSPTCIVHADMTLTWSKVKVTGLLNFWKLRKIALFYVYLLRHFAVELKTEGWLW